MPIRVLVVEDSLTVRKRLVEVLEADPDLVVVGEASDGRQGVELCATLRPDVVTLDIMMPVMNGLAATEHIMAYTPTPILVVSSSMNRGEVLTTFEALSAGAIDVLDKAPADADDEGWERKLVKTVKLVSRIRVITHPRARLTARGADSKTARAIESTSARPSSAPAAPLPATTVAPRLIAMGASTGGPGAVLDILRGLGPRFALPIALVVHIDQRFGPALVDWLAGQSPIPVSMAVDGDPVPPPGAGGVFVAPPDRHLEVQRGRFRLSSAPERHSCRPAVDVLFESIAQGFGPSAIGCLLTGMGKDGALGLLAMRRAGGRTLAQDEASSVVFGMPREAMLLGAVDRQLALPEIAKTLIELAGRATEGASAARRA